MTDVIATKKLTAAIGAEVVEVDQDRLLHDPAVPDAVLEALEEHGVLLFREIGLDDEELVAFGRRLGDLVARPGHPIPEITTITQGADNHLAEYFRGNLLWHIDGAQDETPCKAGILSALVISAGDGGTEFASTYAAYDDLTEEEKERFTGLRVVHTLESTLRPVVPGSRLRSSSPTGEAAARGRSTRWCGSTGRDATRSSWVPTPTTSWAWKPKRVANSWPRCYAAPLVPSVWSGTIGRSATW